MRAEEFLVLADQLPEGMLMLASDGEILAINRVARRKLQCDENQDIVGKNLSSLTGMSTASLVSRLRPCTRSRIPVRLALECSHQPDFLRTSCEGFLLTPASHGELARIVLRINFSESRSDIFLALNREIEKQRRLARKLEASREKLRLQEENLAITLNSIGDAVMVTDKKGLLVSLNPVAEQLTGWSSEEAKGKSVKTVFPIIDASTREVIENPVEKVIASGETVYLSNHTTLIAKDGSEYQIADSAAPIRDSSGGDIQGMVLVFNDVTEQYQLRESNTRNRRNLQAIMDNSPAVIYVKDTEGRYLLVNRQFETLFQVSNDTISGQTDHDIFPTDIADKLRQNDESVLQAGKAIEIEEAVPHADGMHHYVSNKFPLYDSENKVYAICGISSDVSERRKIEQALQESEKKYSTLFEKSADAILLIAGGKFIDCNQATIDMLGYPEKQTLLDTHPSELSPPVQADGSDSFEQANTMMAIAMKNGSHRFEWMHKRYSGESFPVEVLLTAIPIAGKQYLHVVWRDITERKRIERALNRAQKMEAVGQLAGGIAHDFNNILSIILGNLNLLDRQFEKQPAVTDDAMDKTRKRLDNIKHSTERAIKLTRQLLSFSRSDNDDRRSTDLNRLIRDIQNLITQSLTPQVEVEMLFADDLWQTEIDRGDFEDTLLNMVLNARDAMHGRGLLTIETRNCVLDEAYCVLHPEVNPGQYVQLTVSDNGEGIANEIQDRIFEPFFTTKEQGKGTGLGMAMVFGFVQRSGGSIKLYSEPGIGSSFTLFFPRSRRQVKQTVSNAMELNSPAAEQLPQGQETILIVDDEEALLNLAEETLLELGYRVLTAQDGLQALAIVNSDIHIDLLFSDVVMPGGLNGFELAEQACRKYSSLKVLLTSGYTERAVARNGQSRFRANMLSKPYAQLDLAVKVREMLD